MRIYALALAAFLFVACGGDDGPTGPGPGNPNDPPDPPDPPDGETIRWNGAISGDWEEPTNWDRGRVPAPGDEVIIDSPGAYAIVMTEPVEVGSLTFGGATGSHALNTGGHTLDVIDASIGSNALLLVGHSTDQKNHSAFHFAGDVAIQGQLQWTGGNMEGEGTILVASGGTLSANSPGTDLRFKGRLEIEGRFNIVGTTRVILESSYVDNKVGGIIDFKGDGTLQQFLEAQIHSVGSIRKTAGTFTAFVAALPVQMTVGGTVRVDTGILRFSSDALWTANVTVATDATLRLEAGTYRSGFSSTGRVEMRGDHQFGENAGEVFSIPTLHIYNPSTLTGPADLSITQELGYFGGTIDGVPTVTIEAGAEARVASASVKTLRSSTWINRGTTTFDGYHGIVFGEGASAVNETGATWDLPDGGRLEVEAGTSPTFLNRGEFIVAGGPATRLEFDFTNQGVLELRGGQMKPFAAFVHGENSLILGGGTAALFNTNVVIDVSSATSNLFAGTISPGIGSDPARIDIKGDAVLTDTSLIQLDIPGPASNVYTERVGFTHEVVLNGRVEVNLLHSPAAGDQFLIFNWFGYSGSFDQIVAPGFTMEVGDAGMLLEWQ